MWRIIFYSVIQSLLLVGAQVFLKMAMMRMPAFGWNREFFTGFLTNWPFAVCGLFFALSSVLWMSATCSACWQPSCSSMRASRWQSG